MSNRLLGLLRARVTGLKASTPRAGAPLREADILVSGFNEDPPSYPGGLWILRDDSVRPLYSGYGVFGICRLPTHNLVFGVTRVAEPQLLAYKVSECGEYTPFKVEYHRYVPARRAHGICIFNDKLYVVATQGDPDSGFCTNPDFPEHRVGKVIITDIEVHPDYVLLKNSFVWNPYHCDHHHHYNDILVDNQFIYLAAFSTCDGRNQYNNRGSVTRFNHDYSHPEIVTDELIAPHSLQIHDGRLYVCSSSTSSVVSVPSDEIRAKTTLEFKTLNNFIRGLRVTSDYFLMGLSRSAGRTDSAHLTEAINGILKFNRKDGTTSRIEMPAGCDNLYSILSLSDG